SFPTRRSSDLIILQQHEKQVEKSGTAAVFSWNVCTGLRVRVTGREETGRSCSEWGRVRQQARTLRSQSREAERSSTCSRHPSGSPTGSLILPRTGKQLPEKLRPWSAILKHSTTRRCSARTRTAGRSG